MRWTAAALVTAALLAGCGGPWIPVATEADAARTGATVEELERGRSLLVGRCASCHQPPSPRDRRAVDWPGEVGEMRERAGLEPPEADAIVRYLTAFASDAPR